MTIDEYIKQMEEYLGGRLDIYGGNERPGFRRTYVFYMDLADVITEPTGENDITKEIPKEEYPVFVDKTLDSYCTFEYLIDNIMYLKQIQEGE